MSGLFSYKTLEEEAFVVALCGGDTAEWETITFIEGLYGGGYYNLDLTTYMITFSYHMHYAMHFGCRNIMH